MGYRLSKIVVAMAAMAALATPAHALENLKIGVLRCDVAAGLGLIVTSSKGTVTLTDESRGNAEIGNSAY